jgi:hypothetical protein
MQPVSVSFMQPLNAYYAPETFAAQEIASLFGKVYLKAAAIGVAVSDCRTNFFLQQTHFR